MGLLMGKIRPFSMELLPFLPLKNGFWPVILLLFMISEWNFTDMLNSKGYILQRSLSSSLVIRPWLIWKMFLTCSSFTIWNIWMKLHRYVDHQRLRIVTKDPHSDYELFALDWSEKWFLTCSSFTLWNIWMKLHRYVDHQRLHIVGKYHHSYLSRLWVIHPWLIWELFFDK